MTKEQIAEKVVKDYCSMNQKENNTVFNTPISSVLEAPVSNSPYSFEDMDELEQSFALNDISFSRDDEIREIRERLTRLSGGRLANYWYYAKEDPEVAEAMAVLVKRLLEIGDEVLEEEGELTGCAMCSGDGYYPWAIVEIAQDMSCCHNLIAEEAIDYLEDIAA